MSNRACIAALIISSIFQVFDAHAVERADVNLDYVTKIAEQRA